MGQVSTFCIRKPILVGKAFLRLWATYLVRASLTVPQVAREAREQGSLLFAQQN